MSDELLETAGSSQIEIYLDDATEPLAVYAPPGRVALDTTALDDGPHLLTVIAVDGTGRRGIRRIPFEVRNGPGIAISGIQPGDVVEGELNVLVNAYGGAYEENWEPSRAETPAPVPTWVWVFLLGLIAWGVFYLVRQWAPPPGVAG